MSHNKLDTRDKPRNTFFDDPMTDHLIATILNLTAELSVTRERLDTVERLLNDKGVLPRENIESFQASGPAVQERIAARNDLAATVMKVLTTELAKAGPQK